MKILIIGTGYVGLVTGVCLAEMGHHVICLDIDQQKIAALENGVIPIYEPGLEEMLQRNRKAGRLFFTTDYSSAVAETTVCFLALPTPSDVDGSCDISYVLQAAQAVGRHMTGYRVIVVKSTVPVGTAHKVRQAVAAAQIEPFPFDVVSNPEFLKEGSAIQDCMKPDRIILGVENEQAKEILKEIYASFMVNHERIFMMSIASAEMTKYAANAMLATRISFMNELAGLCEKIGANINDVRIGIGSDHRIGYHFLYAGLGYGGSCFPKDISALQAMALDIDYNTTILQAVDLVNQKQKRIFLQKIGDYFESLGGLQDKTIAIWGLSFKPDTDDIREAPAIELVKALQAKGCRLQLFDPVAMEKTRKQLIDHSHLLWCNNEYEAARGADAIILATEWKQFRFVNFKEIIDSMRGKAFFDGRNQYKPHEMVARGFHYYCIGIPAQEYHKATEYAAH